MQRGNSKANPALVARLERIRDLLEESISLARAAKPQTLTSTTGVRRPRTTSRQRSNIDFSTPIRPFVKKHAVGMSGPKKFTLVLAHLAGGDVGKKVSLEEVERQWSRMTAKGLLDIKFNRFYSASAKDNDWVNTEKSGLYHLRPSWQSIFDEKH
ncbi:MAG: hypothetical protein HY067_10070 [Betaproteobacteria bacterium]|nr:hypothetical protein [Betaproteobacteria bacterium]